MSFRISEQWLWRLVVGGTLLSLGVIGSGAWLLYQGSANPPTLLISPHWQDTALEWGPPTTLLPNTLVTATSPYALTNADTIIEAKAVLHDDPLAVWGIWLQTDSGDYLVVGINGSQYVTTRRCSTLDSPQIETCPPTTEPTQRILTYWKTYHHLRPLPQANTIQLQHQGTLLVLRLNQEWMWDIPYSAPANAIEWGLWTRGGPVGGSIEWVHTIAGVSD